MRRKLKTKARLLQLRGRRSLHWRVSKAQGEQGFCWKSLEMSEDGDEPQNDATCLMVIDSQEVQPKSSTSNNKKRSLENEKSKLLSKISDLEIKVKKLANDKEVVEHCEKCDVLAQEVDSLKCNISRLQDEALNFSKFKKISIVLDDMLSR
ncbi:hypothetical protein Tco_0521835 [Tanacetum coccineum]